MHGQRSGIIVPLLDIWQKTVTGNFQLPPQPGLGGFEEHCRRVVAACLLPGGGGGGGLTGQFSAQQKNDEPRQYADAAAAATEEAYRNKQQHIPFYPTFFHVLRFTPVAHITPIFPNLQWCAVLSSPECQPHKLAILQTGYFMISL